MTPVDSLPSVAEIAITLAGFIGLVVVFRPATAATWSEEERARVGFVLILCGLILLCALLPFALSGLFGSDDVIWGLPLGIFGVGNLFLIVNMLLRVRNRRIRIQFPLVSWPVIIVWGLITLATLASALGLLQPFSAGLLMLGMLGNLLLGALTLAALMAQGMGSDSSAD